MCGIVGYQGSFDESLLAAMTEAVAHRGPDGVGGVTLRPEGAAPTGLGHRRLAIIDLSAAGIQPMTVAADPGGGMRAGLTLVYNGEIYNYRELREELQASGHVFKTATDSEVLLHLYERDGLEMLSKLNGIFAFAIHDARPEGRPAEVERGALFVARDPLGVKPLYYAQIGNGFLFASEIKALLRCRELPRDLDPIALHEMLAYLWTPSPRTMLAAVRKLEPGMALLVADGRVRRQWTYYTLPYDGTVYDRSEKELAGDLAQHVETAVRRQLVSDVPVGAFLSGGLDSSAVVAMMRRAQPKERITCFSIGFAGDKDVEGNPADLPYARRVARHLGVDLEEIVIGPNAIDRFQEMIWLLDEPQADPAPLNALLISERARQMNIPVLLSGAGGDDLFSGYRRHWAQSFERYWAWMPKGVRKMVQSIVVPSAGGRVRGQSTVPLRRLAKMFSFAGEDADRRLVSYFWWSTDAMRRALYAPEFSRLLGNIDVAEPLYESLRQIPNEHDPLQRMLYLETRHFLADHNLNYTDRAGMAAGVEIRVPLLDLDLVSFAAHVPAKFKQKGTVGKAIFKKAMEPYLPHDVIYRPKSGFGAPLRQWLRNELREMVNDTMSEAALTRRGFFDPRAVRALIEADRTGRIDGSYTIFALMSFELWCRSFVDA